MGLSVFHFRGENTEELPYRRLCLLLGHCRRVVDVVVMRMGLCEVAEQLKPYRPESEVRAPVTIDKKSKKGKEEEPYVLSLQYIVDLFMSGVVF